MDITPVSTVGQRHRELILSRLPADGRLLVWGARDAALLFAEQLPLGTTLHWIEHDVREYRRLAPHLRAWPGVRSLYCPVEHGSLAEGTAAEDTVAEEGGYLLPGAQNHVDVIVVDGLLRHRCLLRAIELLAPGGTIFLHDAQRERYDLAKSALVEYGECGPCGDPSGAHLWWGGLSRSPVVGRSTDGVLPLIVNFYTANTGYEAEARKLQESCRALNLEIYSEAVPSQGAWELNCAYKARFLLRVWEHTKRPVLWLDADAVVRRVPELLRGATCDFAVHKVYGWQFASGTVFLNQTRGAERLLRRWVERSAATPSVWDQVTLDLAWEDIVREQPLETLWLPDNYTKIFDRPSQFGPEEVVIEHFQASRRLKKEISGNNEDKRPVSDPALRAARSASRPRRQFLSPADRGTLDRGVHQPGRRRDS